ncbi:hypothetical protein CsatB_025813 [Cannabis sativa]
MAAGKTHYYMQSTNIIVDHHQQPCVAYKGPYVKTVIVPQMAVQAHITHHHVPQVMKTHEGGHAVFTDYGRTNKFPLRAM